MQAAESFKSELSIIYKLIKRKVYLQANIDWETTAYKFDSHTNDFYYLFIHRTPNEV